MNNTTQVRGVTGESTNSNDLMAGLEEVVLAAMSNGADLLT